MEVLYFASTVLSLFFILILAGKKNKNRSDKILLGWFVLMFSNVLSFYLITKNIAPFWLVEFLDNSVFLHGPLLWFYTSALTNTPQKAPVKNALHLLPFLVFFFFSSVLNIYEWKYLEDFNYIVIVMKFIAPLIYILASLKMIYNFRKRIVNILSSINQMEMKWLMGVLYGGIFLIVFGATTLLIHYFTPVEIPQFGGKYLNLVYSISIIALGYFGFRQTSIFIPSHLRGHQLLFEKQVKKGKSDTYQKANLKSDLIDKTYLDLLQFMESEKPFIDKNLTLFNLAEQLGVSENKLSHVINSKSHFNFFEFINKYRVELVISKMKSGEHTKSTLLGLALDSGFNSKASFNRAFKKFTELTPSLYLKIRIIQ